jgi:N-acetylglucosaminyldiphosphoundecaprenol N-acetyl-beta-D-mannosaminyltransferase
MLKTHYILGMKVNVTSYAESVATILDWASAGQSRYVCAANVHMVMEGYDSKTFQACVNRADLVTPDGMPLVWLLRRHASRSASRVYGPDLTLHLLKAAQDAAVPVGFFGGRPEVLQALLRHFEAQYPRLQVAYSFAPPFRALTEKENAAILQEITQSCARLLFVGLGCPKQETWMAANSGDVPAVMVGVGAAFDFLSQSVRQAPGWMQAIGLEWAFRFFQEPRRLWRRYLKHNPRFLALAVTSGGSTK